MRTFIKRLSERLDISIVESKNSIGNGSSFSCNIKGNVERIKLHQCKLQSLDDLTPIALDLKVLEISEADLKDIYSIGNFRQLEELDLYLDITSLKGLDNLVNLKKLRLLCTEVNSFKEVFSLDSLVELDLWYPDVDNPFLLSGLEKLKNLESLQISEINSLNKISGNYNLKRLKLYNNSISEIIGMEKWPNLEVLNLYCNPINKIQGLEESKQLKNLNLHSTQIKKIEGLENLKKLENLSLNHNSIAQIEGLEALKNLKVLDLDNYLGESDTPITEIEGIKHLKKLEILILTGQQIVELKNFPTENLRSLEVAWNKIEYIDYDLLNNLKYPCVINLIGNPIKIDYELVPDHITIITE